jgi:hypothetical protein
MTHQDQIQQWVEQYLHVVPAGILRDEAREFFSPQRLRGCHAKSRKTFAQCVRLHLARDPEHSGLLAYMQEHKLPPEEVQPHGKDFKYVVNGNVALIPVTNDVGDHAVWKVPADKLAWAESMLPVQLRPRERLETEFESQLRQAKRQLLQAVKYGRSSLAKAVAESIEDLEQKITRDYEPLKRYMLVKSIDAREVALHRLYVKEFLDPTLRDGSSGDIVEAIDGDLCNFATASLRVRIESVSDKGLAVRAGKRPLLVEEIQIVPNLQVVKSERTQTKFEDTMLQHRENVQGDLDESLLRILPNSWNTQGGDMDIERGQQL